MFAKYDRAASKGVPMAHQIVRDYMLDACGWVGAHGDVAGYFRDYPGGHRCLWSANWGTRRGFITPDQCWATDTMTSHELILEAVDLMYRSGGDAYIATKITPLVLDFFTGTISNPGFFLENLRGAIHNARRGYPDFTFVDPPGMSGVGYRLMQLIPRPGWSTRSEILEKASAR